MNILGKMAKLVITTALVVPAVFVDKQDELLDWYEDDN